GVGRPFGIGRLLPDHSKAVCHLRPRPDNKDLTVFADCCDRHFCSKLLHRRKRRIMNSGLFRSIRKKLAEAVCTALFTSCQLANAVPAVKEVDCTAGKNIRDVLAKAEPGDTIQITGSCSERLAITTDRVTLDGQGSATLNGGGTAGGSFTGVIHIQG